MRRPAQRAADKTFGTDAGMAVLTSRCSCVARLCTRNQSHVPVIRSRVGTKAENVCDKGLKSETISENVPLCTVSMFAFRSKKETEQL